jgi:hypothetical protein
LVLAFSFVLAFLLYRHAWRYANSVHIGVWGDADEYTWFLSWMPYALGHGLNPLHSSYVAFPSGINLMWNTSVLLPSFIISPLTVIAGPIVSYNALMTAAPALSTTFAYMAFRRWAGVLPALVGALVFGFSPAVASQSVGHMAQVILISAPLMLILLDRLLVVQSSRAWLDGLLLGLLAWAQLLTGEEILALEAVAALIGAVVLCAINDRRAVIPRLGHAATGLVVAAVVFGILAAPFLGYQLLGPGNVQNVHPPNVYVNDFLNFFLPTNMTQFSPTWFRLMPWAAAGLPALAHYTGNGSEEGAYIGIPLLVLFVGSLILARRRKVTWVALAVAAGTALLSMGSTLHFAGHVSSSKQGLPVPLPDDYLQRLPFFQNVLPDRFALLMFLGVGLVLALGLSELHDLGRASRPIKATGWGLAVVGLAAIAPVIGYPYNASPPQPAFNTGWACPKRSSPGGPPPTALMLPAVDELNLRWQAESGFCFTMPSATGMTGTNGGFVSQDVLLSVGSPSYGLPPITPDLRQQAARELSLMRIAEIVVSPWQWSSPPETSADQAQLVGWVTSLLGQNPAHNGSTYLWSHLPSATAIEAGSGSPWSSPGTPGPSSTTTPTTASPNASGPGTSSPSVSPPTRTTPGSTTPSTTTPSTTTPSTTTPSTTTPSTTTPSTTTPSTTVR